MSRTLFQTFDVVSGARITRAVVPLSFDVGVQTLLDEGCEDFQQDVVDGRRVARGTFNGAIYELTELV